MAARVFIAETRGAFSQKPDFAGDLQTCLKMARDWPPTLPEMKSVPAGQSLFDACKTAS